jgi:hypothetical protein
MGGRRSAAGRDPSNQRLDLITLLRIETAELVLQLDACLTANVEQVLALHV